MYTPGQYPDAILDAIFNDFQKQITNNLTAATASIAGLQTQIKQVTLTLEGELKTLQASYAKLAAYVNSKLPS